MAQDTTPAIIVYQGDGSNKTFSVPFDKGDYGAIKVAFVRRGLTNYEYNPTTYTVNGCLFAWALANTSPVQYYYTKPNDSKVYNAQNNVVSGVTLTSMADSSAKFSNGKTGYRALAQDISFHSSVEWLGEPLTKNDWICIVRETQSNQPYVYPNNQKHIEGALDNLSRQIQELKAQSEVSLRVDPTFKQDPSKMSPIDWLNTIVRSTDGTARGFRYKDLWLEFSTDDPNKAENAKTWTKLLNTTNVTTIREWYDEEKNEYRFQYSKDNGASWKELPINISSVPGLENRLTAIENEQVVLGAGVKGNTDAIQKTREDYISADSEIHQILNNHAGELTTLRGNQASLGDQVAGIEQKIPESASGSNPLITKQQLLDEEMDIRDDVNEMVGELQTQITAQAAAIATLDSEKLDKNQGSINAGKILTVGEDGFVVPSAGGAGGGLQAVAHDNTMSGAGTDDSPLGLSEAIKDEIADKAPKETVEALTQIINGIIGDYVKKSGDTMTGALNVPEITVQTAEGTFIVSVVAGVVTIATNNGLDIAAQTKFDTAPTTDDNTTWANALDASLVRKAQVATAITDSLAQGLAQKQDIATAINYDNITNCITEIPQDIKLELKDGVLILKAGSTVYVPKGAGVFNKRTATTDVTTQNLSGYPNGKFLVFDNGDFSGTSIRCNLISACYSGATAPATGAVWYDTINNKIMVASGGTWTGNRTLPLGVITISNGAITSIDQVFNGFGYIGSTMFTLPGVSVLIPDGLKEDGSLKNRTYTTTGVSTRTNTDTGNGIKEYLLLRNDGSMFQANAFYKQEEKPSFVENQNQYWYNPETNRMFYYRSSSQSNFINDSIIVASFILSGTKIDKFTPNNVFHAVDYSDTEFIAHQAMPSDRYIDLSLGASGSTYTVAADGWLFVSKSSGSTSEYINIVNEKTNFSTATNPPLSGVNCRLFLPVSMGDTVRISYNLSGATNTFRFIYANGAK